MAQNDVYLEGRTGELTGRKFELAEGDMSLGRGLENSIRILDKHVSRSHALIRFGQGNFIIQDLGSTSGTRVNGERIQTAVLRDGDLITMGETTFKFHDERGVQSTSAAMAGAPPVQATKEPSRPESPSTLDTPGPPSSGRTPGIAARRDEPQESSQAPPLYGRLRDAAMQTQDGLIERLPIKWVGVGCLVLIIIGICIVAAVFGFGLFTPDGVGDELSAPPLNQMTATSNLDETDVRPTQDDSGYPDGGGVEGTAEPTAEGPAPPGGDIIGGGTGEIAFASNVNGLPQIFLRSANGLEDRQLTDLPDGACQPTWAPDGMRMAFTSPCALNKEEYFGSSLFYISFDERGEIVGPSPLPSVLGGGDFDPDWGPAPDQIAFTSSRTGRPQIFVTTVGGAGLQRMTEELTYNWTPTWSPSGDQIAFLTTRSGVDEIWLVPAGGGDETRFTMGDSKSVANPDWSPDGGVILFDKVVGAIPRLVGAPLAEDGLREVQVCQEGQLSVQPMADPAWSPDGTWIAFETWPDGVNHNISYMTTNCTDYRELTTESSNEFDPAWRPAP